MRVHLRRMRACAEPAEGVSLRYKLLPLPGQACPESIEGKGARGMVEKEFSQQSVRAAGGWLTKDTGESYHAEYVD